MINITGIRVEYSNNPIGVDVLRPRFSWRIEADKNDVFQRWYRVEVSRRSDFSILEWDSGVVESDATFNVEYSGEKIKKDTKYFYRISCGGDGWESASEIKSFITGNLGDPIDAEWITPQEYDYHEAETCPMIRKVFDAGEAELDFATLQIHAFGFYELYVNGKRPDERLMAPAFSDNKVMIKYDVYEITELLKTGKNAVAMLVGDGYTDTWNINWEGKKRLVACINLHYKDGSVKSIPTDTSWKYNYNSPILSNSIYGGEIYDATREIEGWNLADFDDSNWENVYITEKPEKVRWKAYVAPRVLVKTELEPKEIHEVGLGRYIIDFGQNISGFVRIKLQGKRGSTVRLRHAEELKIGDCAVPSITGANTDLSLDTFTNRDARATELYIFKGEGVETYQPHFTYHGFRYVEVVGATHKPLPGEFVACAIQADFEGEASFKSDNALLNRIHENALWSFRANNFTVPVDCPQRDERVVCAFDFYNAHSLGLYLYDICAYCESFLDFGLERQTELDFPVSMTYFSVYALLFLELYRVYGDESYVRDNYDRLKDYIEERYLKYHSDFKGGECFGDWCAPHIPADFITSYSSPREIEVYTTVKMLRAMRDMAELLGRSDDAQRYASLAEKGVEEYNLQFYNERAKRYSNGKQTPNIVALMGDIVPWQDRRTVERNLIHSINAHGNRLDVGTFGARLFIECLGDLGYVDLALDCFTRDEFPSFKYQIDKGATTMWEQWYEKGDMSSHNHQMFGGAMTGFYSRLAGVTPLEPGYKSVQIKPMITKHINELDCKVCTVSGDISVHTAKKDGKFTLSVTVPANTRATVILPNGENTCVGNGKYTFECKL